MTCLHNEFNSNVNIIRLTTSDGKTHFRVDINVSCAECNIKGNFITEGNVVKCTVTDKTQAMVAIEFPNQTEKPFSMAN